MESLNSYLRCSENVDQAELEAIRFGSTTISISLNDEDISGVLDDEVSDSLLQEEPWAIEDKIIDTEVGNVITEIKDRSELLGEAYPFTLDGNCLSYTPSKNLVYEFCLCVSLSPSITKGEYVELPRFFEELSAELASVFFNATKYWRTGWPDGKGTTIKEHLVIINKETNEWKWTCQDYIDPKVLKDHGVDYILWKKMPDSREGGFFNLGQCACGNNWNSKYNDLTIKKLQQICNLPIVEPNFSFAIPYQITKRLHIKRASSEAGFIFERTRLTMLSCNIKLSSIKIAEMDRLINLVLSS